jgi:hypothetical protein
MVMVMRVILSNKKCPDVLYRRLPGAKSAKATVFQGVIANIPRSR